MPGTLVRPHGGQNLLRPQRREPRKDDQEHRALDPQTLLYTGLARDGTLYIENGKIKFIIKHMRFNESPVIMLNDSETIGRQQRLGGNLVPPLKVRNFPFTSLSGAV